MSNSVLVVEDDYELQTVLERALKQLGYEILCASSVSEAVTTLSDIPTICIVLWDPTTLPLSGTFVALANRLGVHVATIPVGINPIGQTVDGSPVISKRLTSLDAVLIVLREHCPGVEEQAMV